MIIDMASISATFGLNGLPDPAVQRVERDRALALAYVQLGQTRSAVKAIAEESGVNYRTVYRAIERELEWAKAQQQEGPFPSG